MSMEQFIRDITRDIQNISQKPWLRSAIISHVRHTYVRHAYGRINFYGEEQIGFYVDNVCQWDKTEPVR